MNGSTAVGVAEVPVGAFRSTDGGDTWADATTQPPGAFELYAVAYGTVRPVPPPPSTTTSTTAPPITIPETPLSPPAAPVVTDPRFTG